MSIRVTQVWFDATSTGVVTHATTGTLTAPSAVISGSANSSTTRASSGALTAGTATVVGSASRLSGLVRYGRPDADISDGTWLPSTGSDLYATLDETSYDDADYIYTTSASTCSISLNAVTDPGTSSGQVLYYRARSPEGTTLIVTLKQGGATIATRTNTGLTTDWATYSIALSESECNAITDYSNLSVELTAQA